MEHTEHTAAQHDAHQDENFEELYFHLMATIGMTKHPGGTVATDLLVKLGHFEPGQRVLDVGCGTGFTELYLAREHGLYAVGVDLRPALIEHAWQYARAGNLTDRVEFHVGDAQALPFEDSTFDGVICESVLVFVPDKLKALNEFIRVTRPGGYVGFTESIWRGDSSEEMYDFLSVCAGPNASMELSSTWEQLLTDSGLEDIAAHTFDIKPMSEARNQFARVGVINMLKFWGRALKLVIQQPQYRRYIAIAQKLPANVASKMGYGVYMGRKSL